MWTGLDKIKRNRSCAMHEQAQADIFAATDTPKLLEQQAGERKMPSRTPPANPADPASPRGGRPWQRLSAIALVALLWNPARAGDGSEDFAPSMFSFSGFGTLGVVHSSEDRADFTSSPLQLKGAGYSRDWNPAVDSKIGAQVTATLTPQLSATVQVISEQNYDGTFKPHVEWANIKYQFTADASVRLGRILTPVFLVSDTLKVGYSNPWVRPPVEFYDLVSVSNNDGVDASYRMHLGGLVNTVVATYGRTDVRLPQGTAQTRQAGSISDTAEYGAATAHIFFGRAHLTVDSLSPLIDAFRQFGPQGESLADEYSATNIPVWFLGVGGMYDPGGWFATAEWGVADLHSVFGRSSAWYVSGGYRVATFTPYLTYAQVKSDSNTSDPGLTASTLPPSLAAPATELNAILNAELGSHPVQKTISLGLRWDFMQNLDLKLQYDRIRLGAGSPGTLGNVQPDFRPGGSVNVVSIAIDFVL
jgi:hypothetical protein